MASTSMAMLAAEYSGMSVAEMTTLRNLASEAKVSVRVVKNTLARRAFAETQFAAVADSLKGQLVLAFAKDGPGDAAKVFKRYTKECPSLKVQLLSLGDEVFGSDKLDAIAALPNRDEAIAQLMGTLQAPIAKLAATLNEVPGKLVRTLDAVRECKA